MLTERGEVLAELFAKHPTAQVWLQTPMKDKGLFFLGKRFS
ncbi:MAG: hypothetical protein NZM43_10695 [Saprospiraceae bacterium]|nr:hypothetical protein [Saprospiraceae bacterium]MDW8484776.1 hypothetical protein [Saprospiraceae bacterium]